MKKIFLSLLITLTFMAQAMATEIKSVTLIKIVDHPALNKTQQGVIDELAAQGFNMGKNLTVRVESAQGNPSLASQIASSSVAQQPDLAVAIGTVAAQSFIKATKDKKIKLVFSSVTDPVGAGLAISPKQGRDYITGASNFVALEPQLGFFQKIQPKLKTLGILYNPGEANSVSIVQRLEKLAPTLGLTLVKQAVPRPSDIAQGAAKLASSCDAIFISNDNTALSALRTVTQVAAKSNVPVYVSDTDAVELGALAALGPSQYAVGRQTGVLAAKILKGEDIQTLPITYPEVTEMVINTKAAKKLGITFPPEILNKATRADG